jgi:hypothetical protein
MIQLHGFHEALIRGAKAPRSSEPELCQSFHPAQEKQLKRRVQFQMRLRKN